MYLIGFPFSDISRLFAPLSLNLNWIENGPWKLEKCPSVNRNRSDNKKATLDTFSAHKKRNRNKKAAGKKPLKIIFNRDTECREICAFETWAFNNKQKAQQIVKVFEGLAE